jgi:hypothetical protein
VVLISVHRRRNRRDGAVRLDMDRHQSRPEHLGRDPAVFRMDFPNIALVARARIFPEWTDVEARKAPLEVVFREASAFRRKSCATIIDELESSIAAT